MATSLGRQISFLPILRRRNHLFSRFVARTLLSDSDTKMESYMRQRIFKTDQLGSDGKVSLLHRLETVKTPSEAKQAAPAIANLIHVAQSEAELSELERLFRLISCNNISELAGFSFGASLIRMYHHLGLPERAYSMYQDQVCRNLLADNTCHKVLMDLLYNHMLYKPMLDVYCGLQGFNIDCVTLVLAAHYHINTLESYKASQTLVKDLLQKHVLSRRATLYAAALALNQNQPGAALECIKMTKESDLVSNLKLMCLARLGQTAELLKILQSAKAKAEDITKPLSVRIYKDTMEEIKLAIGASSSSQHLHTLDQLERDLALRGALSPQLLSVLLDRTVLGESNYRKESGKLKILRNV